PSHSIPPLPTPNLGIACPQPVANSCNEPCVRQCPDSTALIQPPPVVVTFPGPILSSFPQQAVVGSTGAPAFARSGYGISALASGSCGPSASRRFSRLFRGSCGPC
uniref:Keratin n=1 Tax=Ficedula albicollis TaxID=59894 RepID=U3JGA4_FICAL